MSDFCRSCGARIPHLYGEGRCDKCVQHDPAWARSTIEKFRAALQQIDDFEPQQVRGNYDIHEAYNTVQQIAREALRNG